MSADKKSPKIFLIIHISLSFIFIFLNKILVDSLNNAFAKLKRKVTNYHQ